MRAWFMQLRSARCVGKESVPGGAGCCVARLVLSFSRVEAPRFVCACHLRF